MNIRLLPIFLSFVVVACGGSDAGKEAVEKVDEPLGEVVGEVTSVHSEKGFLLFRKYRRSSLQIDGTLSARSLDSRRVAGLQLSPESLGRFRAATYSTDQERPRVGDLVVLSKLVPEPQSDFLTESDLEKVVEADFSDASESP
jgi:hypothetical protein